MQWQVGTSWQELPACLKPEVFFLLLFFFFSILLVHANIVFLIIFSGTRMLRVVVKKKKSFIGLCLHTFIPFNLAQKKSIIHNIYNSKHIYLVHLKYVHIFLNFTIE